MKRQKQGRGGKSKRQPKAKPKHTKKVARPKPELSPLAYEAHKERARLRNAELSAKGREIGELPPVADPVRKKACERNFQLYCETYFPHKFFLGWSADHLRVIALIEEVVLHGGCHAYAMPRGDGKTSLCEAGALWGASYGHQPFIVPIGATGPHAAELLSSIKTEVETNELLLADFPEVCFPIQALQGINGRCPGQTYRGERTRIKWTSKQIWLPTIAGSKASAAIIRVASLTARIRGMKEGTRRPTLVLLDDPQTRESASSLEQTEKRERIIAGDVLGLAGPNTKIAALMPCTVVEADDLADRLLDRKKHPEWQGYKAKMVSCFPTNTKLWEEYAEVRANGLRAEQGLKPATDFYRKHQTDMDAGAVVAWAERYNHDEASALQHAVNLKLQDERAFFAEYQNEPKPAHAALELTTDQVAAKTNGLPRGLVPLGATRLTTFIDVQEKLLYYVVLATQDDFTGWIVDYGTYPEQTAPYFTAASARMTLARAFPHAGVEGAIYAGLQALGQQLLDREWKREGGSTLRIERGLVDANWSTSTEPVYQLCRLQAFGAIMIPSHGRFIGASMQPLHAAPPKPGERVGPGWLLTTAHGKRATRHVIIDANAIKTFVAARWAVALGDKGCLSLYGDRPDLHRHFAEHVTAEYRVPTEARGRKVDEWKPLPKRENHWLDCLVGGCVAASIQGASLIQEPIGPTQKLSELRQHARRWRWTPTKGSR